MAEFQPFNALRYNLSRAGEPDDLIAPPYDVVTTAEAAELYSHSPFNIARVDYGPELPGDNEQENRYLRARRELDSWREQGILQVDNEPHLYVYDQEFSVNGKRLKRRAVFGRLRVEDWDSGIVLPHEHTRARDKQDRLDLLRANRVNTSPIMALYEPDSALRFTDDDLEAPVMQATLAGESHTLRPMKAETARAFSAALASKPLYIADGHHRYETALNYRNETRAKATSWSGSEPENFVLAALIEANEPGLVVLPIHRLLKLEARDGLVEKLTPYFEVKTVEGLAEALPLLDSAAASAGTFVAVGLEPGKTHLITVRNQDAVGAMIPSEYPDAWRSLDVALLHYALLPAIGFEQTADNIAFEEDAHEAAAEVITGTWDLAVLLNPTRVDQIIDVAGAGERMPQKSTFFFPKLGTGLVLYSLD